MIQPALRTISRALAVALVGAALPAVLAPAAQAVGSSPIVISQLRAQGSAGVGGTDFIELQNVSGAAVTLAAADKWTLELSNNDGSPRCDAVGTKGSFDLTLQPGQHYLFAAAGWTGTGVHAADANLATNFGPSGTACSAGLDDSAGRVELIDSTKGVVDKVTYGGPVAQGTSTEGSTTLDPSNGDSIRRKVNGTQDTDSNSADLEQESPANPLGFTYTDPTVTTENPTAVTTTTATLQGTVDTKTQTATACSFDIGTDTTYSLTAVTCASTPSGAGAVAFTGAAAGLQPGTTYHYRSEITEVGGKYAGSDKQFTTLPLPPTATTNDANVTGATTATLNATVNVFGGGGVSCSFSYGLTSAYGSSAPCAPVPSGSTAQAVSADLTGLVVGAVYHFKVELSTLGGTATTLERTFTQYPGPTGALGAASSVLGTSATLNGTVNPHGAPVIDCHFEYGPTTSLGVSKPCATTPTGATDNPVSVDISALNPSTTYFFRLVVISAGGTLTTASSSFATVAITTPTVVTDATPLTFLTGANFGGTVNPNGLKVTNCHFEYGLTTAYGTNAACAKIPFGTGAIAVSQSIAGLKPATTYHYRLVATNSSGTGYGDDVAFTTKGQVTDIVLLPDTTLLPPVLHRAKHTVTFTFKARNVTGTPQFQCALVKLPTRKGVKAAAPKFAACTTPKTTKRLAKGRYTFYVRAIGAAGKDPTPASRTFAI